jgi:hypothetical protein
VLANDAAGNVFPQLPQRIVDTRVWQNVVAETPLPTFGVGRWLDSVGTKLPTTATRQLEPLASTGRAAEMADLIADISAVEVDARPTKIHRTENGGRGTGGDSASVGSGFVGVLPPATDREFIEDAAKKLVAKGRAAAEVKLRGKLAFGFIDPTHAFHGYYMHVVRKLEAAMHS